MEGLMDLNTVGQVADSVASAPEFDPSIAAEFLPPMQSIETFLGVPLFDASNIVNILVRFLLNFVVAWVLVHFLYYKKSKRMDYYVTFILFSATMFLLAL